MFLNVSVPLLILNILIQEFNPQFPTYLVQPMNDTTDDLMVTEKIISNIDVMTIKIHDLKFISYPNCIIIFENPNAFDDYESLKCLRKCVILLLIGLGDRKLYLHELLTIRFTKVIAYTTRNDADGVHVILPDHDHRNYKRTGVPSTVLQESNYSKLQNIIDETRMNVNGAEFVASMFPKRYGEKGTERAHGHQPIVR